MFSRRTSWNLSANAFAARLEAARAEGRELLDLTESNPTRAGLRWLAVLSAAELEALTGSAPNAGWRWSRTRYSPTPLREGETLDEEALCLTLLEDGVAVQPGFFFDFERPGHLVVSLLCEPAEFTQGIDWLARRLRDRHP